MVAGRNPRRGGGRGRGAGRRGRGGVGAAPDDDSDGGHDEEEDEEENVRCGWLLACVSCGVRGLTISAAVTATV